MGWQARLSKDQKPEFKRTCNKCHGTGIKRSYVSINGVQDVVQTIACKCLDTKKSTLGLTGGPDKYPNP